MKQTIIFLFFISILFFVSIFAPPTMLPIKEEIEAVWQTEEGLLEEVTLDVSSVQVTTKNLSDYWRPSFSRGILMVDIPVLYHKKIKEYAYLMKTNSLSLEMRQLQNEYSMLLSSYGFFLERNKVSVHGIKIKKIKIMTSSEDIEFLLQKYPNIIRE